ncbi:hypothetical protein TCAL_09029 [Tigriopus californicus]|uniref:Transmembrane protein adipocyte-associated 1 homolog n=1 Tax=Tigriopus californicus TaxID=6832 RepID=A0A553NAU3_TIGCA|nr:transmembrane protein adipocyte-associated 1 homolog [Tigriopus californicus]TRY62561.1 hypothetical protein TCAL_09029 [Tigriopus californicus]|eukprot:TCALIF_09029-PA protein Name:"Similar to Tpra1 Transmembrane protein adipocyte-associated 1 (Rattus norvegicus)" AED:0.38 eAED:0.38 QI:395/1/1/1/1/1/2/431/399
MDVGEELLEEVNHGLDSLVQSNDSSQVTVDHSFDSFQEDPFFNPSATPIDDSHFCKKILYCALGEVSGVRLWDLLILVPNVLFLSFLLIRLPYARLKLRATNTPIFTAFYGLVLVCAVVSVVRCLVSMSLSAATSTGDTTDKVLWIVLRFSLLATEMSVLVFGLGSGHLDSQRGIRRVVVVSFVISFIFSFTQTVLELWHPDANFHVAKTQTNLFGHGGMLFWLLSSALFTLTYMFVLLLPFLPCRRFVTLPQKRSFYQYVGYLLILNAAQTAGSLLVYVGQSNGLCVVNLTTFFYFTTLPPVIYFTFLRAFFSVAQPQVLFSYKAQVDDFDADEMHPSASFNDFPPDQMDSSMEVNAPIVINNGSHSFSRVPQSDLRNTGIASPDSVINYNFTGGQHD